MIITIKNKKKLDRRMKLSDSYQKKYRDRAIKAGIKIVIMKLTKPRRLNND